MKRKLIVAVIMTAMLAGSLAGCGNKNEDVSAVLQKKEAENEVETSVTELMKPVMDCMSKVSEVSPASVEVSDKAVAAEEAQDTQTEAPGTENPKTEAKADTAGATTEKPKVENSGSDSMASGKSKSNSTDSNSSGSSGSSGKSKSNESAPSNPNANNSGSGSGNSAPTSVLHTHNWKEHTAARQVWIPNIVVVDDYEDRQVQDGYEYVCGCGMVFDTTEAIDEHILGVMYANFDNKSDTPFGKCTGYENRPKYKTEHVKVGSHEEDHGHYENETYVDYYYCDCGARK